MTSRFNFRQYFVCLLLSAAALSSCSSVKDIAYFQNKVVNQPEKIDKHAGIVIQPKDMLSIVVSSRNPELVSMFNLPVVSYQAGSETVSGAGVQRLLGYVVDNAGYIDFPVLGPISVSGMTRWELSEMIKNRLIKDGLLTDAVVTVEFMNFKVSVLGEVNAPGTYTIEGDKVTVLQAISLARDLTIFGLRENVSVIRERDGERTIYQINLCDVNLFKSPAYYLQQNDIIYVEPNQEKARQSTTDDKTLRMTSILVSGGSLLVSIATLVTSIVLANR
ncbi:MAG: polysaccharide biosynthesis/export family protein [Bacteroidales bacterium]|nr:polysaccharide biosynthesis/export family protein [Bacteroidales bacterium]